MAVFVALLRAVNVGGTGILPMTLLRTICEDIGFADVRTYIQSGNVVFRTDLTPDAAQAELQARLHDQLGKTVAVHIRDAGALQDILTNNPFPTAAPNRVSVVFLDHPPPADVVVTAKGRTDEDIKPGLREIYIHYPSGMGQSKLRLAGADRGTARNLNTVAKLAQMALGHS